jgi:Transcriptional regulator, AbiEi antitoxin, Type IV TA system
MLTERGANWVDETGAARIVAPGLLVIREGLAPPERTRAEFAWSPSAIAAAEALLARDWSNGIGTTELANLVQWSAPQISQVLNAFDERGWTVKFGPQRGRRARRELIDAGGLLGAWADFLEIQQRETRHTHRTMRSPLAFLEEELADALGAEVRWAVSGWAGAHELAPFSDTIPSLEIYVHEDDFNERLEAALKKAKLSDVAEGGRVTFYCAEPSVLALSQSTSLAPVVSGARVYADLLRLGGRGVDAAEHLKEEVLDHLHPSAHRQRPPRGLRDWERECQSRLHALTEGRPDLWAIYERGTWSATYRLLGAEAPNPKTFRAILREVAGNESGWPPWWVPADARNGPRPIDGTIECWLSDMLPRDPANADFWRADPHGRLCLIRPYQEDSPREGLSLEPRTKLDLVLPVLRTGECLLHSERLARRLDARAIQFMTRWTGLAGRQLASLIPGRHRQVPASATASAAEAISFVEVTPDEIDSELASVVRRVLAPLYESFGFFEPPAELYEIELSSMRSDYPR